MSTGRPLKLQPWDAARLRLAYMDKSRKTECVAADFGITQPTMRKYCKGLRRTGTHDDEIRCLSDEGLNPNQIAKRVGLTRMAVANKLKKWRSNDD